MRNNVKHILPIGDGTNKTPVNGSDWKEELKIFLCALIDVCYTRVPFGFQVLTPLKIAPSNVAQLFFEAEYEIGLITRKNGRIVREEATKIVTAGQLLRRNQAKSSAGATFQTQQFFSLKLL